MSESRADLSLYLDVGTSSGNDDKEAVQLRRDGQSLRRARTRSKERTPTAVVSDAFSFLNANQISLFDAIEDGCFEGKNSDSLPISLNNEEKSKCDTFVSEPFHTEHGEEVPGKEPLKGNESHCSHTECHFSEDSGFASLERHLSDIDSSLTRISVKDRNEGALTQMISPFQFSYDANAEGTSCSSSLNNQNVHVEERDDQTRTKDDLKSNVKCSYLIDDDKERICHCNEHSNSCADCCSCSSRGVTVSNHHQLSNNDDVSKLSTSSTSDHSCESHRSGPSLVLQSGKSLKGEATEPLCILGSDSNAVEAADEVFEESHDLDIVKSHDLDIGESHDLDIGESNDLLCDMVLRGNRSRVKNENRSSMCNFVRFDDENNAVAEAYLCEDEEQEVLMRKRGSCQEEVKLHRSTDAESQEKTAPGLVLEMNPATDLTSDDSSDEDAGIYAESHRRSNWVRVSQEKATNLSRAVDSSDQSHCSGYSSLNSSEGRHSPSVISADVLSKDDVDGPPRWDRKVRPSLHQRSDSVTTTASESEFQTRYMSRRKCLVQRAESQQEYHRMSTRIYEGEEEVIVERTSETEDLGMHLLDSHPAYITSIDSGSPAAKAGMKEGQILVWVNEYNVLTTDHHDLVELIQKCKGPIRFCVASSDFLPVRDIQAPVISGYFHKLGNSTLVKTWKKRYFVLRNDNCLYYYKTDQDLDPLGALPLIGYTISRHTDTSRNFCFKAEKYRARTYYFMTENRDQLTQWVAAMTEAAIRSKKQKESSFLSVSSHNVSLPALDIRRAECSGHLMKMSPHKRTWQRRYCLLKDACIYYYKDVNSLSALGVVHLHGYKVDVEGHAKKRYSFLLQPPDPKMRQFYFAAENDTDKKRWVESTIHSIQRWVPVSKELSDC